jgi:hypothetical protein
MADMTDYEILQEAIKVAGTYILPIMNKHNIDDTKLHGALTEAFQAGVEYAVTEMTGD